MGTRPELFHPAIGTELAKIGPQVLGLGLIANAGNGFFGAGYLGPGVTDVFDKIDLVPGEGTFLVGV